MDLENIDEFNLNPASVIKHFPKLKRARLPPLSPKTLNSVHTLTLKVPNTQAKSTLMKRFQYKTRIMIKLISMYKYQKSHLQVDKPMIHSFLSFNSESLEYLERNQTRTS